MSKISSSVVGVGLCVVGAFGQAAWAQDDDAAPSDTIRIIGERANRTSSGATGLNLSLAETPQSVTLISRELMDDFGFDTVNDVLNLATGVNVEEVETDRTYYNARGFDIKSMQVDGIGLPFTWNVVGELDTAVYDRVEVIRGANGLLTGTGNPSGTINYVRKRPTNDFEASAEITVGSWDQRRIEGDLSGPLTENGSWAGRLVAAAEESESYLNLYSNDRTIVYGVVDGQLGDNAIATFGYTQQDNASDGVLWGALPMYDVDGVQPEFDVSTTTSMDWTFWDTHSKTAFAELTYALPAGWEAKAILTHNDYDESSELFYVYAFPAYDQETGLGLYGYPGAYDTFSERTLFDAQLSGPFTLGGRRHEAFLWLSLSEADSGYNEYFAPDDDPAWGALPAFPGWTGTEIARPDFGELVVQGDWTDEVNRLTGVTRLDVTDALDVIVGFNAIDVQTEGFNFGAPMDRDEDAVSPYIGVTYLLTDNLRAYASYSDIYEAQSETDAEYQTLDAAEGRSYEAGLKGEWFDRRLYTSLAYFRAEQDGYAEWAGYNDEGVSYYMGIDFESEGFELEAAGRITDTWSVQAGYTDLELTDPDTGADARTFIPRRTFNLATTLEVPAVPGLELGGSLKWQDDIHLESGGAVIRQDAFTLASVYASYELTERVEVGLNVNNLTDEQYLASLYWDQAFYGAPREVTARLRVAY